MEVNRVSAGSWMLMEGVMLCVLQVQSGSEQSVSRQLDFDGRH